MNSIEFEKIYSKYFDMIYRVCFLYMKNEADALDVVQDVFLKVWNGKLTITTDEQLKAWLIVTASNSCKSQLKRWWNKKRTEYDDSYNQIADNNTSQENSELLEEVLALEEKYSVPVYLHYYEGYSTIEIGKLLNMSSSTVRTRLAKARKLLKLSILEKEDKIS